MPIRFELIRKSEPEKGPVKLTEVDEELCLAFHQEPNPSKYLAGWVDSIGLRLAMGRTWDEIREGLKGYEAHILIVNYLEEHFQVSSGWSPK